MKKQTGFDLLVYIKPILNLVPDIQRANRIVPLKDKIIWTSLTLILFLVCSQTPLFGIQKLFGEDPVYWSRVIMASNRGTLMELGIGPIISAGMVVQVMTASQIIRLNPNSKDDRELNSQLQKLVAIIIAMV